MSSAPDSLDTTNGDHGQQPDGDTDVLAVLEEFRQQVTDRLDELGGKHSKLVEDVVRNRKRLASREGGQGGEQQPAEGRDGTRGAAPAPDNRTLWRLSKITAKLPEAAQARVDAFVEDGDLATALVVAETLMELTPAEMARGDGSEGDGTSPRAPTREYGATPVPRKPASASYPKTRGEWMRLRQRDEAAFQRMSERAKSDPNYSFPSQ